MASTYTESLRLTKQGDGENAGNWGNILNTVIDLVDDGIAGQSNITITGVSAIDFTGSVANGAEDEARKAILKITGNPTENCSITVPAVTKFYVVDVSLDASTYSVHFKANGSAVDVTVRNQEGGILYCDGTDMKRAVIENKSTTFLEATNNLSDLTNVSAMYVNIGLSVSAAELNLLDGLTASASNLNRLTGLASVSAAELDLLDGLTASATELNILDGVEASMSVTNINYLNDVTSSIQAQLDTKVSTSDNRFAKATGFAWWNGTAVSVIGATGLTFTSVGNVSGQLRVHVTFTSAFHTVSGTHSNTAVMADFTIYRTDTTWTEQAVETTISAGGCRFRTANIGGAESAIGCTFFGVKA